MFCKRRYRSLSYVFCSIYRGQSLSTVMKTVEDMMLYEIEEDKATKIETKEENKLIEQQELKEGEIPVDNRVLVTFNDY